MKILDRYITRHANQSIFIVMAALLSLISMYALFEELDENQVTYGIWEAIRYIVRTLPRRLDEIMVYAMFLGYLIALGRLAETSELTIARVSGMSISRLMLALGPSMLLWLSVSLVISEYIAPRSERLAEVEKLQAQFGDDAINERSGFWLRAENLFMQVQTITEAGTVHGIRQYYTGSDRQLESSIQAKYAIYDAAEQHWVLYDGQQASYALENDDGVQSKTFESWVWENPITPEVLASQSFLEPNKMSMLALYKQVEFAKGQHLGVSEYQLALWARILKPLTYMGLTLFALAVVIGPLRQVGMGYRLTIGIFAGLGFKYLQDLFAPAALVFNIPAQIAILIPIVGYWLIALVLIRRNA